jgi:hypothetical protein
MISVAAKFTVRFITKKTITKASFALMLGSRRVNAFVRDVICPVKEIKKYLNVQTSKLVKILEIISQFSNHH